METHVRRILWSEESGRVGYEISFPALNNHVPRAFFLLGDPSLSCFCFVVPGRRRGKWHPILSRRWNLPAQNDEKVTVATSAAKRPRRCKCGYWHVARIL